MNELSDGVYKFVIVGRIFFVATCLITAILLTVTAIKASNVPVSVIQDPDTSFTTKEDSKDNPEVPIAGDISEDSSKESKNPEENHEEKPAEAPTEQTPQQVSAQPTSVNITSHSESNSNPTSSKPARPAFDYDKVYYVDDNDPDASSIPIIPGNTDNSSGNTISDTISNTNSNTSENTEPVEAANSGKNS